MKAILVLFDSLNRHYLPSYGDRKTLASNFRRLEQETVIFDTCYAGSLPCMPARRELHTGRYNFMHRNWGPLEPFDDSMPEQLSKAGIYTHLVTDHAHYWEDGGATYHTRYSSWEGIRGQQGDHWKGEVKDPEIPPVEKTPMTPDGSRVAPVWRYDWVNRKQFVQEEDYPQNRTFNLGLEFIQNNHTEDNWFLQIETFDPHEPFIVPERFKNLYDDSYNGELYDWPRGICDEDEQTVEHVRNLYRARVSMCDENLGRLLDTMDALDMWKDTLLIVGTDHGFLLGEHAFWGKNGIPMFEEISHTPLYIWDPRSCRTGERRSALVQTIDFAPTILDYFNQSIPESTQGKPLRNTIESDIPVREAALFGIFGEQINITDGRYVYMRAPADESNTPLNMYTLMPTNMFSRFSTSQLSQASLSRPEWKFLKDSPILKMKGKSRTQTEYLNNELFDLQLDPEQRYRVEDQVVEKDMERLLIEKMIEADAPLEQFQRLGLILEPVFSSEM
ncbi:MAG: sulfatase [Bacteroidetes bacterium]|nr:sulfatase [Bacteroidota bacterium]